MHWAGVLRLLFLGSFKHVFPGLVEYGVCDNGVGVLRREKKLADERRAVGNDLPGSVSRQ